MDSRPPTFKVILVGDQGAGKSSLREGYCPPPDNLTIALDFSIKNLDVDGKPARIQLWDTAGQERFRTIGRSYYRRAHGVILVYDITNRSSFESLLHWTTEMESNLTNEVSKLVLGAKSDLTSKRQVDYEEGHAFAASRGMLYMEASSKTYENVDRVFLTVAEDIVRRGITLDGAASVPMEAHTEASEGRCWC